MGISVAGGMNIQPGKESLSMPVVPNWLVSIQCFLFITLYSVWILPKTLALRNSCLGLGALIGLYLIVKFRTQFLSYKALGLYFLVALFLWTTFHLFFLSVDFELQLMEYQSTWKRTLLGSLFAIGLGLSLTTNKKKWVWPVFYFGLLTPSLIYIFKFSYAHWAPLWHLSIRDFLATPNGSSPFYVSKIEYVSFCLPTLAVALGQLLTNCINRRVLCAANLVYILSIAITLFPFYGQNIKNGVIYSGVLILIFTAILLKNQLKSRSWPALIIASLVVIIFCSFAYVHIKQNNTWLSLIADAKVAFQTDEYDHWKYGGAKGYPNNERGQMVSITNYERIAWLKIGLALAPKKPWGYGLIQDSFGKLAKLSYPDSNLTHSHSGWLDILLGLGLPGFLMIMIALGLGVKNVLVLEPPWGAMGVWALMALLFLFLTTEASNKIEFDQLIFWIALVNSLWILSFVPHPAKAILS